MCNLTVQTEVRMLVVGMHVSRPGVVAQVIMGLDWVRQHYEPPAVVVMALGGESQYALDMAVRNIALSGLPVVVAAGNEDTDACSKSPAR